MSKEVEDNLRDCSLAVREIDTALTALMRSPEIRRTVTRQQLFFMLFWQSMEKLEVGVKPELLAILTEKIGFDEAQKLIVETERALAGILDELDGCPEMPQSAGHGTANKS